MKACDVCGEAKPDVSGHQAGKQNNWQKVFICSDCRRKTRILKRVHDYFAVE